MTDYLQPVGNSTRRLAALICLPAALLATAVTALVVVGMIQDGRVDHNGKPLWVGAVVGGLIALTCWWLSVRLWIGRPANQVTVLPLWFIELSGVVLLAGSVWLWLEHRGVLGASTCLGGASAMLLVRRAVRRRSHLAEKESERHAEPS